MQKKEKAFLLDRLVQEGWFADEREALPWILSRKILVDDKPVTSLKEKVSLNGVIRVKEYYKTRYVNKGGLKLEAALRDFHLDVKGKVALDCGASTGGFTDCLISHGAAKVYAVDVGHGQLAGKLLNSSQVVNLERTNLSDPGLLELSPRLELISLDLSYLSLKKAVPICREILHGEGIVVALIKPLFEVESSQVRQSGKIENPLLLKEVLEDLCRHFDREDDSILGLTHSPVRGNHSTVEYFICLGFGGQQEQRLNGHWQERIQSVWEQSLLVPKFDKNSSEA